MRLIKGASPPLARRLADLLDEIASLIGKFVALPHPDLSLLVGCWIAQTYCFERFRYCGYLALRSAIPGCGKTRLLRLLRMLSKGTPSISTAPTAAVLYRSSREVWLLDEVDRLRNADRDTFGQVIAILNVGFEKGAVVERASRHDGDFEVVEFKVYGPKALAGIEELADTLADRAFHIYMDRAPARMLRLNEKEVEATVGRLRRDLQKWAIARGRDIDKAYRELPTEIEPLAAYGDRFQDISEPMFVLATLADAERSEGPLVVPRLLSALRVAHSGRTPSTRELEIVAILKVIEAHFSDSEEEIFLRSTDLVSRCKEREDLSGIFSEKALASLLNLLGLSPRKSTDGSCRGYRITRAWLDDKRSRYRGAPAGD